MSKGRYNETALDAKPHTEVSIASENLIPGSFANFDGESSSVAADATKRLYSVMKSQESTDVTLVIKAEKTANLDKVFSGRRFAGLAKEGQTITLNEELTVEDGLLVKANAGAGQFYADEAYTTTSEAELIKVTAK